MFSLKHLRHHLRMASIPPSVQVWAEVVGLAVTSNSYSIDDEIRVLLCLQHGKYRELLLWADAISQQQYGEPMLHYRMHQIAALIRKYPLPASLSGLKPREAAIKTFMAAEHRCKRVNQRIRASKSVNRDRYMPEFWHARNWIQYVIGDKPNILAISKSCDFTSGASLGIHGNATNIARKLNAQHWTVTPGALPLALGALWDNFHIREHILEAIASEDQKSYVSHDYEKFRGYVLRKVALVRHNKVSFVPKTAKTDRSIAVEPTLNTFIQKGIDTVLRQKLRRVGLDLSDQSTNCELARLGSLPGVEDPYCTIDLSSASDTIAIELVKDLLPPEWYELLSSCRSPDYLLNGKLSVYQKFTSMGNGFCFPLQTLIYASLCHAACVTLKQPIDFRVYGDDIIVRQSVFGLVIQLLKRSGFTPNARKTFNEGPFRESCGMDWHTGMNVRPIYLDHPLDTLERWFGFHNQSLRRESYVQEYFREIRSSLFNGVPFDLRLCSMHDPALPIEFFDEDLKFKSAITIDGAFWVPRDVFMGSKFAHWNMETQSFGYVTLRATPCEDEQFRSGHGKASDLPPVFHIGALRGGKSAQVFSLRYQTRTKPVRSNYLTLPTRLML